MNYSIMFVLGNYSAKSLKVKGNNHIEAKLFIGLKRYDDTFIHTMPAYPTMIVLIDAAQTLCIYTF